MLASEVWRPSLTWRVWVYSTRGAIEAEVAGMAPPTPSGLTIPSLSTVHTYISPSSFLLHFLPI
ncbi:hypothetical protein HanIR_Chr02g0083591 [Helianthus annuus]|nr:hypothetical protein HanIR_Chr02g0083591 [Helianthus annuus]